MSMKYPNPKMLLRIAQGDAFGHGVEYIKPEHEHLRERALRFEHYIKHPTHNLAAGQYTDDTQMSIAVAEVLVSEKDRCSKNPESLMECVLLHRFFADSFVECFQRDPRDGYARGFQKFLEGVKDGKDFLDRIDPKSDKNGAAMRSVPLGVLPDPELIYYVAGEQAKLTHATSGGIGSSLLVGIMSHFALYHDDPLKHSREFFRDFVHIPDDDEIIAPWPGGPIKTPNVGINTARAVMTLISTETTLLGIARKAIEWGGDTDSVLSIAWGIASTRMQEDLPPFFEGGLEDGIYGRDFLLALGTKLMDTYAAP